MSIDVSPWTAEFRAEMAVAERWAYFDHAAVAPLTRAARAVLLEWANDAAEHGDVHWPDWRKRLETTRGHAATLIGAKTEDVALIRNTTEGVGLVAEGFPWRPGDNVVTPTGEFPTNLYPWLNLRGRGVEVRFVETENERLDLDRLDDACDERTRIVAVSWVGYATGWRNDVEALCDIAHRHGAFLFLDAIQGLGVFPLDVSQTPVDFLAADGHKWLLGPEGAGLFYLRHEHLDLLRPLFVGWNSVTTAGDYTNPGMHLKPTADRYEGGTYNMAGLAALGASLELLLKYGTDALADRILAVTDRLCARLTEVGANIASDRDGNRRSGIVAFTLPGRDSLAVKKHCLGQGVALTCRAGRLRASPHVYTNEHDLTRLIGALACFQS